MDMPTAEMRRPDVMSITDVADTYLEAFRSKDPRKALLAPDVTWQSPLTSHKIAGRDTVMDYMLSFLPGVDNVKLERHMTGGDYVSTLWQLETVWGEIPICTVFRIADGLIQEARSFWDPRPILPHREPRP